ncbi:MAG TPA: FAD-binding and (Fe-S)-binding domain-containing protein [Nitrospiraceae bacterium]|nr:FAD-binding and (Fe-S)-binding domain-containing protein [Nitrospiraceae bacterium]
MPLILPDTRSSIANDLRQRLGRDKVKDDQSSRRAYAVDASIYRLTPDTIALAHDEADIQTVIRYAVERGIPLTPRAAGTNLTGSAIGTGIILDVSPMNRILEVNREAGWARIQPGIVLAELNKQLAPQQVMFGPDPSSGEMCKLGGMLANNSSGPHTLRYGSVKDNVQTLRICLSSGEWLDAQPYRLTDPVLHSLLARHPGLATVRMLVDRHRALIQGKAPRVSKNSSGYNLFGLADGLEVGLFDLPKLFVGSEGTLGVVSEARITLVPRPAVTVTALLHFAHLEEVGEAVPQLLTLAPSALEIMDAHTLDLIGRSRHGIPSEAAATLLIELDEEPGQPSVQERSARLRSLCRNFSLAGEIALAFDREERDQLWKARKALYPTLYRFDAKKKPINYVDDVVVRAERVSELIRYLDGVFGGVQVPVAIFGHIGNGNAHIVPLLDVNDPKDFERMVATYHEIHNTVLTNFDGSICGEHGDGRVRAGYVRRMFGDELYDLFVQVKQALDPSGLLNPGVKLSETPFTEHIDYTRLSKSCATCAKCNAVCPVYDVFQSEDMSSRGWYEIVTASDYSYLESKRVVEACLNCKSCRTVCPAGVDVSELILRKRAEQPNKAAGWIFRLHARPRLFEPLLKLLAWTQPWWDRPALRAWLDQATRPFLRRIAETARLAPDIALPTLARRHLRDRHQTLIPRAGEAPRRVAYFHGCAANYFDDGVGEAVITVLRRLNLEPDLPPQRCSGTPIETYGHRALAKEGARFNLRSLAPYETVVTGCASCTLMLKDYAQLFAGEPEEEDALRLAGRVKHISEVVAETSMLSATASALASGQAPRAGGRKVTYHSSCHLRAAGVTKPPRQVLTRLPGIEYVEMVDADRCAGGAGTYLVKDYETSQRIVERKRRAVEQSGAEVVATSCPACMIQLRTGLKGRADVQHVAQLVADALGKQPSPHGDGGDGSA